MNHSIQEIGLAITDEDGTRQALFAVQDALRALSAAAKDPAFLVAIADELAPPERSIKGKLLFLVNHFTDMKEQAVMHLTTWQGEHDALVKGQRWLVHACAQIIIESLPKKRRSILSEMQSGGAGIEARRQLVVQAGFSHEKARMEIPDFDRSKLQGELDDIDRMERTINLFLKTRNESLIEGIKHLPEFDDAYQKFHPAPTPPAPVVESSEAKLNRLMATVFGG